MLTSLSKEVNEKRHVKANAKTVDKLAFGNWIESLNSLNNHTLG